jgi:uncharacterized protein YdeI (YjbR/CyaY-like superfamily)
MGADYPQVQVESRQQWRDWLAEHSADSSGIWLVTWRKGRGAHVPYEDVVEEALCFGWIDGQARRLDDDRTCLRMTPRRPRSGWARTNKARVERLLAAGLMTPAGLAVVEAAKADGSWSLLDEVEALHEPDDLRAALDAVPEARAAYDGFPPSARRALLLWLVQARTAPTRERRLAAIVEEARHGRRAQ